MHVVGTAGHVDHGKSTLIRALTGIDPDRLKEEKEREMTIDLGFAWKKLPGEETVSIVDVPGHEDFIKNMLAGVGGIDAVLFIIAADEAVMPQTREHLAILDLLEVEAGLVALTKIDLVQDEEWLDLVMTEVASLLEGTSLEGAPIVPVSAHTGQGLTELENALSELLQQTPTKRNLDRPRLSIDRVFTMSGFGTVVTGTLIDGELHVGDEVEIQPNNLKARVRGLQTHKQKLDVAVPGSRVAINITGVTVGDLTRGDVITSPKWLKGTNLIDVQLRMLEDAPWPLKHNFEVEVFSGAARVLATTRILGSQSIAPGQTGWAQLRLAQPIAVAKEDRFILRSPSPSRTLGGGVIVDPHPRRRYRRFRTEVIERLSSLVSETPEDLLLGTLLKQEPIPARLAILHSQLEAEKAVIALQALLDSDLVIVLDNEQPPAERLINSSTYLISSQGWSRIINRIRQALGEYHQQHPLRMGMPREELNSRLNLDRQLVNAIIEGAGKRAEIIQEKGTLRLPDHEVAFTDKQQAAIQSILHSFHANPLAPPSAKEVEAKIGEAALFALIEQGQLIQVSEEIVFLPETYEQMVERIRTYIREHGTINVSQARDMLQTTRKYALPLLEYLDDLRITRRVGDDRILLE